MIQGTGCMKYFKGKQFKSGLIFILQLIEKDTPWISRLRKRGITVIIQNNPLTIFLHTIYVFQTLKQDPR
ncbi:hypothetical protein BHL54_07275 [Bacillus cereus]|nr:hypothetical protein BHL54_07275 [Bacillus cereus]